MDRAAPDPLGVIRGRIDAIDARMHQLLIERSTVVAELIEIKGASKPGGAFRPDREADMMRRMVLRHQGALPLVTVEHIWREIITTFTAMQAPFGVAAGPAADALALRDVIRFYFGFSIQVTDCASAAEAIGRVARSAQDVAVLPADTGGRWWAELAEPAGPKIFAKLPFLEVPDRPAALPAYVVGPPLNDLAPVEVCIFALTADPVLLSFIVAHDGAVVARAGTELLVELPAAARLADVGGDHSDKARFVGGFAQPIRYVAQRVA